MFLLAVLCWWFFVLWLVVGVFVFVPRPLSFSAPPCVSLVSVCYVLCLLSFACCVRLCSVLVSLVYGVYGVFVFSWVLCGGFLVFFVLVCLLYVSCLVPVVYCVLAVACSLFALLCSFVCWLFFVSWLFIVLFVYLCWVECVFCVVVGCVVQVVFAFWVCVFGVCFGVAGCVGVFWWVAGRGF